MIPYAKFYADNDLTGEPRRVHKAQTTLLDVGHGMCVVTEAGDDYVMVVDCAHAGTLVRFLRDRGRTRISSLVVSHLDRDHYEGITALLDARSIEIDEIFINPETAAVEEQPGRTEREMLDRFWRALWNRVVVERLSQLSLAPTGFNLALPEDLSVEVIWPEAIFTVAPARLIRDMIGSPDQNALSLICRMTAGGAPELLLTSDTNDRVLDFVERSAVDLRAPVLQMPHHGGNISKADNLAAARALAQRVRPYVAVVQNGRNRYDNPKATVASGLIEGAPRVHLACNQLNVNCCERVDETELPKCAGNVSVLHQIAVVMFERDNHLSFVQDRSSARCSPQQREAPVEIRRA